MLTGKRGGGVSKEMKDYICGYYGKAPGRIDPEIMKKVAGNSQVLPDDVPPSSLVTTTYDEVAEEVGDLAQSEEDVLMYALFPNEARTFLSKHRASEKVDFLMQEESSNIKEDDYVDINQIRELVRVAEESGVGEFVKVGDEVAANQTLCIVEAMKLMNEITAEEMGTVREVCVKDADPVEFGTVLFYIEPHSVQPVSEQ